MIAQALWSVTGYYGLLRAGHDSVVPRGSELGLGTSQAAALREEKGVRPSEQRGSCCAVLGVVALQMVSHGRLLGLMGHLAGLRGKSRLGSLESNDCGAAVLLPGGCGLLGLLFLCCGLSHSAIASSRILLKYPLLKDAFFFSSFLK